MLVLPSDHLSAMVAGFAAAVAGCKGACRQATWSPRITPTGPETGFGYIEAMTRASFGAPRGCGAPFRREARARAAEASWLRALLLELGPCSVFASAISSASSRAARGSVRRPWRGLCRRRRARNCRSRLDAASFAIADISVDYAVMEKRPRRGRAGGRFDMERHRLLAGAGDWWRRTPRANAVRARRCWSTARIATCAAKTGWWRRWGGESADSGHADALLVAIAAARRT